MALTLLLTLNDINKPINRCITLNVVRKWRYLSSYAKQVKVLFWQPTAAILVAILECFTSNQKQNNIKMDSRDKTQLTKWCNILFCMKPLKSYNFMIKGGHLGGHLGFLGQLKDTLLLSAGYALYRSQLYRIHRKKN